MPKKMAEILPAEKDRLVLEQLAQNDIEDPRVVERARILLAYLNKQPLDEIAAQFQVSRSMIFRWRARFIQDGVAGLWDRPRTGKPPRYDEEFKKQVLQALTLPPPPGLLRWDGQSLARYLGASDDAVWRVLRRQGISLARQRIWTVKTRQPLSGADARLAGLYIAPPVWMIALRSPQEMPEEAQVYTRNRISGNALIKTTKIAGELNLQQALKIMAQGDQQISSANKRREEMFNFLNDILQSTLPHQQLTLFVLGDAATLEISSWMAAHQEVHFKFYETMEAAQNRLEEDKATMDADYGALMRQIMDYPHDAPPFIWKTIHPEMDE